MVQHFEFDLYEEIPIELSADQDVQYFEVYYINIILIYFLNIYISINSLFKTFDFEAIFMFFIRIGNLLFQINF